MDTIVYGLMPAFITLVLVFTTLVGLAGEILHAEAAKEVAEAVEEAAEEVTESVEEAGWTNLELQLKVARLEDRVAQLEEQLLLQHAVATVKKSIEDFDMDSKEGRADARAYLWSKGVAIPPSTNRYQIQAKFRLVA